jgi:hypothetical protein
MVHGAMSNPDYPELSVGKSFKIDRHEKSFHPTQTHFHRAKSQIDRASYNKHPVFRKATLVLKILFA